MSNAPAPQNWGPLLSAANVPTLAQLTTLLIPAIQDGQLVWCSANSSYYHYLGQSGAAIDGVTVLATRNGFNSRWIQLNIAAGPPTPPGGTVWIDESASFNATLGTSYMVHSSAGAITANLPGSTVAGGTPTNGASSTFVDADGDAATSNITLNAAPLTIQQIGGGPPATTLVFNNNGQSGTVTWNTVSNIYVVTGG